jgi:hypothetical protein
MSVSKFKNLRQFLYTVIEKKNTRLRRSIRIYNIQEYTI